MNTAPIPISIYVKGKLHHEVNAVEDAFRSFISPAYQHGQFFDMIKISDHTPHLSKACTFEGYMSSCVKLRGGALAAPS